MVVTLSTGCAVAEPPTVAMEPGEVLVWELEYENHSSEAFALYVLTANTNAGDGASGLLLEPCVGSPLGPNRMVAPFSVHIEPAGPLGVGDVSPERVEALPVVIDSDELPAPVSQEGYRLVIGENGEVDALVPVGDGPIRRREDIC